jgi:squalene synthase HpnC
MRAPWCDARPGAARFNDQAVSNYKHKDKQQYACLKTLSRQFHRFAMAVEHYENFPVASILLPHRLRPAVHAIYRFARSADDIADEGDALPEQRLAELAAYRRGLDRIESGLTAENAIFAALHEAVVRHSLPLDALRDLISAFEQDIHVTRYADYASLLDYCSRSANPVGRLMLALYGHQDAQALRESDAICSALQLINFLQDVAVDLEKDRIYLPQVDLQAFGVNESMLRQRSNGPAWQALMRFQVQRSRALMLEGAALPRRLPGRIGWELRLVVQGGLRILEKIEAVDFDVFHRRPTVGKRDLPLMLMRALRM